MPHKRAKRSVRERERADRKTELPPSQALLPDDTIPKSMSRVLNAYKVQQEFRDKKRKLAEEENGDGHRKKKRKSEGDKPERFDKKGSVPGAKGNLGKGSNYTSKPTSDQGSKSKNAKKTQGHDHEEVSPSSKGAKREGKQEFETYSSSRPKRLNDIVQAPPILKVLPRGAQKTRLAAAKDGESAVRGIRDDVVSPAQKRMLELEREKAIARYRAMKEARATQS